MKYLNELKKLIGEELTVLEMDNKILSMLELDFCDKDSMLNGDNIYYAFENGSNTYSKFEGEEDNEEIVEYNVCFDLVEENEHKQDIVIRVTDIEIL